MTGQFWVSLCPVAVHRGLYPFKERKVARCGWLGGRGGSFLIKDGRDGFRFFRTALLQNRLLFHFVCQVLNHRAACDVIIPLDNRCHIKRGQRPISEQWDRRETSHTCMEERSTIAPIVPSDDVKLFFLSGADVEGTLRSASIHFLLLE
ncbi:hypothetical protein T07_9471 [Trichinella nelsoni]|uniref:Uncharacterized protein n=1 Tax=Trichinella nelsoni TaxID=6336 RepID=A0A0V0S438_9BILA|nr:hypothetical protein T07_9471 [Trichinella nelsoni]